MSFFSTEFLRFFQELAANNHKEWFDANRKRYEQHVKEPFKAFIQHLIDEIAKKEPQFKELKASDCIFRINRDIRFSKDKTPYKTMCSAVISPNGKKSSSIHGIYLELGPEHARAYGGIYEIDKEDLMSVREGIAAQLNTFKNLYSANEFSALFGSIHGEKNKKLDKSLQEAASIEPLLFNKQFYFYATFEPELVLSPSLDQQLLHCYEVGQPLERFFNQFITRL
ncbi:MAG: hypothetical protein RLZZ301_1831 [Bacteroidota bacterium]|jgi:uncharacterized protein (TIGR02453 family)